MARHVIALVFATLALVCLLQTTNAQRDDWVEIITGKLQQTIEENHVTCSNYEEFCDKKSTESSDDKPVDPEISKMTAVLCKGILKIHVCDVDLDEEPKFD